MACAWVLTGRVDESFTSPCLENVNGEMMEIIQVQIDQLKHAEYNPRKITPEEFEHIKKSIEKFGLVQPLVVNKAVGREGIVIGGNQRLEVMKKLEHKTVDVVYVNISDIKKEKELNVRLNKNQAGWDFEILNNEFLNIELINWGFNSLEIPSLEDLNIAANEKEFDENIKTDMQCPSCGYKYS